LYKRIKIPKLAVHGENDRLVDLPDENLESVLVFSDADHFMVTEKQRELSDIIKDFFKL